MTAPLAPVRLRRSWPQRLLIIFNVFCIVAALTTAVGLSYVKQSVGEIPRVQLGDSLRSATRAAVGKAQNYLIVGVDSGAGLAPSDPVLKGRAALGTTLRSDTIMVLHIDPRSTTASILSFPRDLWVPIAGTDHSSKINTAIETPDPNDGPQRLIKTLAQDFQIPIDHYLQIDLAGFKGIVKAVGGVPVYFATPARDLHSLLNVPDAGCVTLDGAQALAYARSRYYEVFIGGKWRPDPSPLPDLARISRQQDFIKRIIRRAISRGVRNPTKLRSLMQTGVKSITLDDSLRIGQLTDLGLRFKGFNPDNLKTYALPVVGAYHGDAAALDLKQAEAQPILALFQGVSSSKALATSSVKVQVLNGSGGSNQATIVTQRLVSLGFQTDIPGDAVATARTLVRYAPGHARSAQLLARHLAGPVRFEQAGGIADVQLVTGRDFAGVRTTAKPLSDVPISTTTPRFTGSSGTGKRSASTTTPTTVLGIVPRTPAGVSCG